MIETHNKPLSALSDFRQQITPEELMKILKNLILSDTKLSYEIFKDELLAFRNQIDLLDRKIIELLNDRKKIVQAIAKFKNKNKHEWQFYFHAPTYPFMLASSRYMQVVAAATVATRVGFVAPVK